MSGLSVIPQSPTDAAMHWFERLRERDLPESEVLTWLSWYEQNEENSRAFDELQDFWRISHGLAAGSQGKRYIEQLQQYSWWHRLLWRAEQWFADRFSEPTGSSDWPSRPAIAWAVGGAAIVGLASLVLSLIHVPTKLGGSESTVVTSASDLVRTVRLPDDSKVQLAPHTTIAVSYSSGERRLEMSDGEASFEVAPNKKRPFVVHVDALRVRAVGTQFDIHRVADRVVVTVIEGKIDVYRDGAGSRQSGVSEESSDLIPVGTVRHVTAGQQFTTVGDVSHDSLTPADSRAALTWREGRLRYVNAPLATVIADINRYVARPIVINDDKLKTLSYTGTVFTQSIDEWLGAIPKEFPLVVVTESDRTLLMAQASDYQKAP